MDRPRQIFGTIIDENAAKKALENFKITDNILGINQPVIKKINSVLCMLYSKDKVNLDEYYACAYQVQQLWADKLRGENILPSIQLISDDFAKIIKKLYLKPGLLTKKGLEAIHKLIKYSWRANNCSKQARYH